MRRAAIQRVFTPEFYGNRDLPEDDQVIVEMDIATIKERDQYSVMRFIKGGKTEITKKEYLALRKKVNKISNYFDENGIEIDTADKLIADMEAGSKESIELCTELWNRIMGYDGDSSEDPEELTEGEE